MIAELPVAGCSMSLSQEGNAPGVLCRFYLLLVFFSVITFVYNSA